jgi:hypothetical protein
LTVGRRRTGTTRMSASSAKDASHR